MSAQLDWTRPEFKLRKAHATIDEIFPPLPPPTQQQIEAEQIRLHEWWMNRQTWLPRGTFRAMQARVCYLSKGECSAPFEAPRPELGIDPIIWVKRRTLVNLEEKLLDLEDL